MAEGRVFFQEEPVLRITAPLPEAQFIESRLINLLHYQTLVASKAARCRMAAPDKTLIDFGLRRAHGGEAALLAARANYIAGFSGTATVQAEQAFGIPIFGTMAHSYVQAHASEERAFENYARSHPDNIVLLIDTYDVLRGAKRVTQLANSLRDGGIEVKAVRLDSGDLAETSSLVRHILDEGGCANVAIFASGDLDEYRLAKLCESDCPIDSFGVGTRLNTSEDAPSLDCVFKLQEYGGEARRKRSQGKATWPGRKQVYRRRTGAGLFDGDMVTLASNSVDGDALIAPVMRNGERLVPAESLDRIRKRSRSELDSLPDNLKTLRGSEEAYPVEISAALKDLAASVDQGTA